MRVYFGMRRYSFFVPTCHNRASNMFPIPTLLPGWVEGACEFSCTITSNTSATTTTTLLNANGHTYYKISQKLTRCLMYTPDPTTHEGAHLKRETEFSLYWNPSMQRNSWGAYIRRFVLMLAPSWFSSVRWHTPYRDNTNCRVPTPMDPTLNRKNTNHAEIPKFSIDVTPLTMLTVRSQ